VEKPVAVKVRAPEVEPMPGPSTSEEPDPAESTRQTMEKLTADTQKARERLLKMSLDMMRKCHEDYASGRYSPVLMPPNQAESGAVILDPEEDEMKLFNQRMIIIRGPTESKSKSAPMSAAEAAFEREARQGMNDDEAVFAVETLVTQDKAVLSWADKYRPRKPRYFNRVHTGFEWNKYNQTHYDVDNPPPKIVQGYKFNIFYPDLINKGRTPTYHMTRCKDNPEFSTIRFSAGPPYEDIAFKIVNREWNYSYKSGFRSQFHNNILQLWFHFKRYRYRR
jgi:hypothetical protein